MEKAVPVETCLGYFLYRDSVILDHIKSDGVDWSLIGKIDGHHVTKNPRRMEWIPFEIKFLYVQNIFTIENGDERREPPDKASSDPACFHIIQDSFWIKPRDTGDIKAEDLKHYRLKTCNIILHVSAKDFEFRLL